MVVDYRRQQNPIVTESLDAVVVGCHDHLTSCGDASLSCGDASLSCGDVSLSCGDVSLSCGSSGDVCLQSSQRAISDTRSRIATKLLGGVLGGVVGGVGSAPGDQWVLVRRRTSARVDSLRLTLAC